MSARRTGRLVLIGLVGAAALGAHLWSQRAIALPELGALPAFHLTDERGQPVGREAFAGKVSVVDFIFTSCGTACPLLSAEMARLQEDVRKRGLGGQVRLWSISVDPERDSTEKLAAFAARWGADPALWRFLRGPEGELRRVVVDAMKQVMDRQPDRGETDDFTILHGTRMVAIDGEGRIRGFYDANDPADRARLRAEVTALARGHVRTQAAPRLEGAP